MKNDSATDSQDILRRLPAVDELLRLSASEKIARQTGAKHLTVLARAASDCLRREILQSADNGNLNGENLTRENLLVEAERLIEELWQNEQNRRLQKVVNATGVVIHTNLGRAPLSDNARKALVKEAAGYCNLEYDLESGKRGRRGARAEKLLAEITGAESALIVNNCAAAAFLILTVLSSGGETIVSRGELVEIGGDFRVPDVMAQSGATMKEVGTTNRTKISDYENAITENTRLLLKVHPSNYRIVGFTESVSVRQLADLARRKNIIFYEDAGSGAIFDLSDYGLTDEPVIRRSIADGADVISFSGDKLLGGSQSGLIVGRREVVEKIGKHPLYRALRVDKLIYAALEATFEIFRRESHFEEIPVLRMLAQTNDEIKRRARNFAEKLQTRVGETSDLRFEVIEGKSVVGGGSAPTVQPATTLVALKHRRQSVSKLEQSLRFSSPPIIARISGDEVLIDLRTVSENEENELLEILAKI
jgi:L-seryl-tRNA(Ser) seleniumtransferase